MHVHSTDCAAIAIGLMILHVEVAAYIYVDRIGKIKQKQLYVATYIHMLMQNYVATYVYMHGIDII